MSGLTSIAVLASASDKSAHGTDAQPTGVDALYRRLQIAGAEPVAPHDETSRTYVLVADCDKDDRYWTELWKLSGVPRVHIAFADLVIPQCPLLSAERAMTVMPSLGLQVPKGSAWVTMHMDLARFLRTDGTLDESTLHQSLETCVDVGEELHDVTRWTTPDKRHDAWLNRRLGILVTGFGDVLEVMSRDPEEHDSLRFLNQLLVRIRSTLRKRPARRLQSAASCRESPEGRESEVILAIAATTCRRVQFAKTGADAGSKLYRPAWSGIAIC